MVAAVQHRHTKRADYAGRQLQRQAFACEIAQSKAYC